MLMLLLVSSEWLGNYANSSRKLAAVFFQLYLVYGVLLPPFGQERIMRNWEKTIVVVHLNGLAESHENLSSTPSSQSPCWLDCCISFLVISCFMMSAIKGCWDLLTRCSKSTSVQSDVFMIRANEWQNIPKRESSWTKTDILNWCFANEILFAFMQVWSI